MRKTKAVIISLLLTVNLVFLNACADIREINELGLVTAVGIDKAQSPNKYSVTVQIANPNSSGGSGESKGGGGGGAKSATWIGTADGESIFEAVRKLSNLSSRRIMWAHNSVVIIGDAMAKEGITPIVDFFTHNPELRMKTAVVICEGDSKKYISGKAGMDTPSGVSFTQLESYRALAATSVVSRMLEVSAWLQNEYASPVISKISMNKALLSSSELEKSEKSEKSDKKEEKSETMELAGSAVFQKDKMIGWLSPEETRGVSWILNQTKNTIVTVSDPEHGNQSVSIEINQAKSKINSKVVDKKPEIEITVTGKGTIVEEDGSTSSSLSKVKEEVSKLVNKKIEDEIKKSLDAAQKKYKSDIFDFAHNVHAQHKKEWVDISGKWHEIFPEVPIKVSVNININSSMLKQEPMKIS